MVSPEAYKKNYIKTAEKTLLIPRGKEGGRNEEHLEVMRMVENNLSRYPGFVGVTLRGSAVLGYVDQTSDIDISILHDTSRKNGMEMVRAARGMVSSGKFSRRLHYHFYSVDPQVMEKDIHRFKNPPEGLVSLCEFSAGERMKEVREKAALMLHGLPEELRAKMLSEIVERLVFFEEERMGAIEWRITDTHGNWDKQAFIAARRGLWQKRVNEIFDI